MRGTAPLGARLVGQRMLRPKDLELGAEEGVVLVDLVHVDEAKAPARAPEQRPLGRNRMAQAELPRMLALCCARAGRCSVEEKPWRRRVHYVACRIAHALRTPAERELRCARELDDVLQVERLAVLRGPHMVDR